MVSYTRCECCRLRRIEQKNFLDELVKYEK